MDLIILNDGLYSLVPVTKAMLEHIKLFTEIKSEHLVMKMFNEKKQKNLGRKQRSLCKSIYSFFINLLLSFYSYKLMNPSKPKVHHL